MAGLLVVLSAADFAFAFTAQDDQSIGYHYASFSEIAISDLRIDGSYFQGEVETSPPNSIQSDERIESQLKYDRDLSIPQPLGLYLSIRTNSMIRVVENQVAPKTYVDENEHRIRPRLAMSYRRGDGIKPFVGIEGLAIPKRVQVTSNAQGVSRKYYDSLYLVRPVGGVMKSFGTTNAGMFLNTSAEKKRRFRLVATDDQTYSGDDTVFDPMEFGVFGRTKIGVASELFLEMISRQAGTGGEKDSAGKTTGEDHYRLSAKFLVVFQPSLSVDTGLTHQTLSYGDQTYMTMESIPFTALSSDAIFGSAISGASIGVMLTRGEDTQSLPEFNATYRYRVFAIRIGIHQSY